MKCHILKTEFQALPKSTEPDSKMAWSSGDIEIMQVFLPEVNNYIDLLYSGC